MKTLAIALITGFAFIGSVLAEEAVAPASNTSTFNEIHQVAQNSKKKKKKKHAKKHAKKASRKHKSRKHQEAPAENMGAAPDSAPPAGNP